MPESAVSQARGMLSKRLARNPGQLIISLLPGGQPLWIEQEIAIATYIQRVEKRTLPVIAFIHESVGREGIRDLLHLNPTRFRTEEEILAALPHRLLGWKTLSGSGIQVELHSGPRTMQEEHWIRKLSVILVNDSNQRISSFKRQVRIPAGVLKHWSATYPSEVKSDDARYRIFACDETFRRKIIPPHNTVELIDFEYCTRCAAEHTGETSAIAAALVGEAEVEAKVWIEGREYSTVNTVQGLSHQQAEETGLRQGEPLSVSSEPYAASKLSADLATPPNELVADLIGRLSRIIWKQLGRGGLEMCTYVRR